MTVGPWLDVVVLEQKADRLPGDLEVSFRCNYIDDPTSRHPTPWSNRVDPEFDFHQVTLSGWIRDAEAFAEMTSINMRAPPVATVCASTAGGVALDPSKPE